MKKKDTVIFDLDGTLLYTIEDLTDGVNYALSLYGYPVHTLEEVTAFVGNGIRNLIIKSVPSGLDDKRFEDVFSAFKTYYGVHCSDKTRPYDGICGLLKTLSENGIRTAVVSNKNDAAVKKLCEKYFGGLICEAMGEREGIARKPSPEPIFGVLKDMGSSIESAVYVGDSEVDVECAERAGIDLIAVNWGFRDRSALIKCGADVIVSSPSDIPDIIGLNV